MKSWLERRWTVPLFLGLTVLVYADPLFGPRSFGGRDLSPYNYPTESAVHDAYARGRLPIWEADISGGRPLLANPNAGALYPVRWLLAAVRLPLALRIYPILHWAIAGVGMLFLLRRLGTSEAAAWIAAVTYVFSGVSISEVSFLHIQPGMTLLPWILWAVIRKEPRVADACLLGVLFGLDMLAGDIFTVATGVLCASLWIVVEESSQQPLRRLGILGLGLGLGALLAAPQILATALWIPETNRGVLGMTLAESFYYSVSPWRLLEFLVPYSFGEVWGMDDSFTWGQTLYHGKTAGLFATLYLGAFPLFALVLTARQRIRGARWARLLAAISLAVAVIPALTPRSWLGASSPIPLRNPEKLIVACVFGLAVLAGFGLEVCRERRPRLRWALGVGAALAALALGAHLFPSATGRIAVAAIGGPPEKAALAGRQLPAALAEGGLLWIGTLLAALGAAARGRASRIASLILLSLITIAADRPIAQTFREEEIFSPTAFARTLARRDPGRQFRTLGESNYRATTPCEEQLHSTDPSLNQWTRMTWIEHTQTFWKRGTVLNFDFDNGDLSRVESLRRVSRQLVAAGNPTPLFASLALRWGIRFRDQEPLAGYERFGGDLVQSWDECGLALPAVRLLDRWEETRGSIESFQGLIAGSAGPFLDTGQRRSGRSSGGRVSVLEDSPERLRAEIQMQEPGWLFVLRAFWSYRDVLLDGRPVEVVPAQLAFSAVPIPSGRHRLEWQERVPGGTISRWGPVLFLLLIGGILVRSRHKDLDRRQAGGAPRDPGR
jgi:hypothetical protein